jgi:hypothetical protein
MGSRTNYDGEIAITPALTWAQIRQLPKFDHLEMALVKKSADTEQGQIVVITCAAVRPRIDTDSYRVELELERLVDALPGGHEFSGHIDCQGEEPGDLTRLVVSDGAVCRISPIITWPEA